MASYQVNEPVSASVNPDARAALQAFFDGIAAVNGQPSGPLLDTFLDDVRSRGGSVNDADTLLYFLGELSSGLATVSTGHPAIADYLTQSATFIALLRNALVTNPAVVDQTA